jgi:SAM-dependent methyltransferase
MDAAGWDERYSASESTWGIEPNRFVREQCERLPVGDALDLACGEGRNALWLASLGWRVTGVDFSRVAIERARAMAAQRDDVQRRRMTWRVADVVQLPLKAETFDLVVVSYLHLPPSERDPLLRRCVTALRPRGRMVLVGHDARNLAEGVSGPQDLALLYQPDQVRDLLADCGLVVEVSRTVERPTEEGVALDTVVRARRKTETVTVRGEPTR